MNVKKYLTEAFYFSTAFYLNLINLKTFYRLLNKITGKKLIILVDPYFKFHVHFQLKNEYLIIDVDKEDLKIFDLTVSIFKNNLL